MKDGTSDEKAELPTLTGESREPEPRRNRNGWELARKAAPLVPNILTLCAVMCGLTAIRLTGEGQPELAMAAIFGAVVLDVADGFAARLALRRDRNRSRTRFPCRLC